MMVAVTSAEEEGSGGGGGGEPEPDGGSRDPGGRAFPGAQGYGAEALTQCDRSKRPGVAGSRAWRAAGRGLSKMPSRAIDSSRLTVITFRVSGQIDFYGTIDRDWRVRCRADRSRRGHPALQRHRSDPAHRPKWSLGRRGSVPESPVRQGRARGTGCHEHSRRSAGSSSITSRSSSGTTRSSPSLRSPPHPPMESAMRRFRPPSSRSE